MTRSQQDCIHHNFRIFSKVVETHYIDLVWANDTLRNDGEMVIPCLGQNEMPREARQQTGLSVERI